MINPNSGTIGFQRILLSSLSLLVGSTSVFVSLKVLQSETLQMDHYLGQLIKRETNHYPIELLATSILALTFGLSQIVFSLMFFIGEVGWRSWSWMNLCLFFLYSLCTFLTAKANNNNNIIIQSSKKDEMIVNYYHILFQSCSTFHTILLINVALSFTSILHSILMLHVQSKYPNAMPTDRRLYYID